MCDGRGLELCVYVQKQCVLYTLGWGGGVIIHNSSGYYIVTTTEKVL